MIDMKIEGVVLAAGLSSRAGGYKLTLKIKGKTIIENCIEALYDICTKIIVVGGYNYEIISQLLSKYSKVIVIYNANYRDGMFSSVRKGIEQVTEERFFLIPADYPLVKSETYRKLLSKDGDIIIPTYEGRKGHPVLIKKQIVNGILMNSIYTNLKEFIEVQGFITIDSGDPGILLDVDTIDDYKKILAMNDC